MRERAGHFRFAADRDGPWPRTQTLRILGRIRLVGAEFVIIVVSGDVLVGIRRFGDAERGVAREAEGSRGCRVGFRGSRLAAGDGERSRGLQGRERQAPGEHGSAREEFLLGRYVRGRCRRRCGTLDMHMMASWY